MLEAKALNLTRAHFKRISKIPVKKSALSLANPQRKVSADFGCGDGAFRW